MKGLLPEAISEYRAALAINPNFIAAQMSLADSLHKEEKFDEAKAVYSEILVIEPDNVIAMAYLKEKVEIAEEERIAA